jgi:uncharacterized protein
MYNLIFEFVKSYLEDNDGEFSKVGHFPFRKRSEHIRRVFIWAKRLVEDKININKEAIFIAALFHDVGYAVSVDDSSHAEYSAEICQKYLSEQNFSPKLIDQVAYLIRNHSNKELLAAKDTPLELIILMEADLLDETGALSIAWDCMMEGSQEIQTFENAYNHIKDYSYGSLEVNPMVTNKAVEFWEKKQKLVKEFTEHLSYDLGIQEDEC